MAGMSWLPVEDPVELLRVDATWSAVSLPTSWAEYALKLVGAHAGPVFEDPHLSHHVWILAPRAVNHWPDLSEIGVTVHGPGGRLLVPGEDGCHDGTRWLRPPANRPLTDPELLRAAVEQVVGPLEDAAAAGPVVLCAHCGTPMREGHRLSWFVGASGPYRATYACTRCWIAEIAGDSPRRHLHAVRQWGRA
ncbi:hypothetical protein V2S66_17130 [Streptomyces sp. V4-01]|uniref:Uncharacterized protein n=1 Tax=Actinacidiphila polyblastidii TaxID=3110430 RepID=A0ABU7PDB3_9ACTN|nr:hypothetical protein [Streptomyces sp. V4-01]